MELDGFTRLSHQAAGHPGAAVDSSSGVLFAKQTTHQEIDFYSSLVAHEMKENDDGYVGSKLYDWLPRFMGSLQAGITKDIEPQLNSEQKRAFFSQSVNKSENPYIVLGNLLHGYKSPSIIDIKLGKTLTDPLDKNITKEKHDRLAKVSSETTSGSLNLRVCGMKTFKNFNQLIEYKEIIDNEHVFRDPSNEDYVVFDKWFGRNLTKDTIIKGFEIYFLQNELTPQQQKNVLEMMIKRLQVLFNCLIDKEIRLFSSSILIIFENDKNRWKLKGDNDDPLIRMEIVDEEDEDNDENSEEDCPVTSSLNLIDFAHARLVPGKGPDNNVLDGVENLLNLLEKLYNELQ